MLRTIALGMFVPLFLSLPLAAVEERWLIPIVASSVAGMNGSQWQSELLFYNASDQAQVVTITKQIPLLFGGICLLLGSPIPPGASRRATGCTDIEQPGAAAVEITTDSQVDIRHRIVNTSPVAAGRGEYSQTIPLERLPKAYSRVRLIHNLRPLQSLNGFSVRHNLGIVNANDRPLVVRVRIRLPPEFETPEVLLSDVVVGANSLKQVNDFLGSHASSFAGINVPWTLIAEAELPFYAYVSEIDNTSNDATFFRSIDAER